MSSTSYNLYKFRAYWLRHPIRTTRLRLDRVIVRYLYPQRPFITFGPNASAANLSVETREDGIVEFVIGEHGHLTDVHTYDGTFRMGSHSTMRDSTCILRRPNTKSWLEIPVEERDVS